MNRFLSLLDRFSRHTRSRGLGPVLRQSLQKLFWQFPLLRRLGLHRSSHIDLCPVFICGVASSGTTLLSGLLDQHYENAGCLHESALAMAEDSPLRMRGTHLYESLDHYWNDMFIPDVVSDDEIRAAATRCYAESMRFPKDCRVLIDKAPNVHLVRAGRLRRAFPEAKFVLMFRDPVDTVEGLRRKWRLFTEADLTTVCDFWESVHQVFLEHVEQFALEVKAVSYVRLIADTDATLHKVARFCCLQPRNTILDYPDKADVPGKGLRNIVNGQIEVVASPASGITSALSPDERVYVAERLWPMYTRLQRLEEEWETTGEIL